MVNADATALNISIAIIIAEALLSLKSPKGFYVNGGFSPSEES